MTPYRKCKVALNIFCSYIFVVILLSCCLNDRINLLWWNNCKYSQIFLVSAQHNTFLWEGKYDCNSLYKENIESDLNIYLKIHS